MLVVNLVPLAGAHVSYAEGQIVEFIEPVARARISAGLARAPTADELAAAGYVARASVDHEHRTPSRRRPRTDIQPSSNKEPVP